MERGRHSYYWNLAPLELGVLLLIWFCWTVAAPAAGGEPVLLDSQLHADTFCTFLLVSYWVEHLVL